MLEEVRYVHGLKRNLISLGELEKKGYIFKGEKGMMKVLRECIMVMKCVRKNGLYALKGVVIFGSASTTETIDYTKTVMS